MRERLANVARRDRSLPKPPLSSTINFSLLTYCTTCPPPRWGVCGACSPRSISATPPTSHFRGTPPLRGTGFALAGVAQIFDRDVHSSKGFPDPGDVELEDDRNFLTRSRELGLDVRHVECCREGIVFINTQRKQVSYRPPVPKKIT